MTPGIQEGRPRCLETDGILVRHPRLPATTR
jgi:hypothetical protein